MLEQQVLFAKDQDSQVTSPSSVFDEKRCLDDDFDVSRIHRTRCGSPSFNGFSSSKGHPCKAECWSHQTFELQNSLIAATCQRTWKADINNRWCP